MAQAAIDAWLVPPHNPQRQKRAADRRSRAMRLSALFEEFAQYLKVERGASHRSIDTYRRYFGYFQNFAKDQVGGVSPDRALHLGAVPELPVLHGIEGALK